MYRRVPDSLELNYLSAGAEGSFFGFYDKNELDLFLRLEHRNYNTPENRDDYNRFELDGRVRFRRVNFRASRRELRGIERGLERGVDAGIEIRIAGEASAVSEGASHRFRDRVEVGARAEPHRNER